MNEIKRRLQASNDWSSLIEELEAETELIEDKLEKSRRLYVLGQACEELFLRKDKAMMAYQKAFKLQPKDVQPLVRARNIYREMGNLKMVAKLLDFELKGTEDAGERARLLSDLAMVHIDLRQADEARVRIAEAQALDPDAPGLDEAMRVVSYEPGSWRKFVDSLHERARTLIDAEGAEPRAEGTRLLVRAARICNLEDPDDPVLERTLQQAVDAVPTDPEAAFLYESLLQREGRIKEIERLHEQRIAAASDNARDKLYRKFASLWAIRFADPATTASFYQRALHSFYANGEDPFPGHMAAFRFLRDVKGPTGGWDDLLELADEGLSAPLLEDDLLLLSAAAGEIAWRELSDPKRAAVYFDWVRKIDEDFYLLKQFLREHPSAFDAVDEEEPESVPDEDAEAGEERAADVPAGAERDTGAEAETEPATDTDADADADAEVEADADAVDEVREGATTEAEVDEQVDEATAAMFSEAQAAEKESPELGINAWRKVARKATAYRTPLRALARLYTQAERWNPLVDVLKQEVELLEHPAQKRAILLEIAEVYSERLHADMMVAKVLSQAQRTFDGEDPSLPEVAEGQIEILDRLVVQYEKMNRWSELIGALGKKAELVSAVDDKVRIWTQVAELFTERFHNQADAIKAYEKVLALDPTNSQALSQLKAMYERRRDWDKLIAVWQSEINQIEEGSERAQAYLELARLAALKLKRPQVSMDLWGRVLDHDPTNIEALQQLEALYERAKDWSHLAEVCRRQVDLIDDSEQRIKILQKLGVLYSDKISDPQQAIQAWRDLLAIDAENRRAQDSLKKLYLAAKAYDELEAFYAGQDKWDEYIRVLEREVDSQEPDARVKLHFRIAELWQSKIGKPERAVRAYEKILAIDESNLEAAEALIPLFEGGRDVRKYVQVLEIQLRHTDDDDTRLERLRALAQLTEEKLRDHEAAFGWSLQALEVDPSAAWTREQAERLAGQVARWPELVSAYELTYDRISDPADRLPLYLTVARVYEEELANVEAALRANQLILEVDPQSTVALGALERLYGRTEQWGDLLQIYQRKIESVVDPDAQRDIYFRIAQIQQTKLGDAESAIESYRTILEIGGPDAQTLRALGSIYQSQGRSGDLAEALQQELALLPSDDHGAIIDIKYRLGRLEQDELGDPASAIECYRDILELDRGHEAARTALEGWLESDKYQLEVTRILRPIYAELEEWQRLVDVLEIQLSREEEIPDKVELLLKIGSLLVERIGDGDRAFNAYSRCFRLDPANEMARSELQRLAEIQDRLEDLAALYEAATEESLAPTLKHELLLGLAEITDERLEQTDRAIEFYQRALEIDPGDNRTLDALEKLYTRQAQWEPLLGVYARKVDSTTEPEARQQLLGRMAYLWEEMLGNLPEAISAYRQILDYDDADLTALKALDRLYQMQGDWPELVGNLSRQLAITTEEDETIDLLVRLANLRETELGETVAAVDTYRQVLEREPRNPAAVSALERLVKDEEHELSVAQLLEPYYKATEEWRKLVDMYEIMVRNSFDPARKIELLHQIAELHEVAGEDPRAAFEVYGRALRDSPGDEATQQNLDRLARQMGLWEELVGLYQGLVPEIVDESALVFVHMKVAAVLEQHVADPLRAAQSYRSVLAVDPQNIEAVDALEQIYVRTEAHQDLVDVLLKKAEIVLDADARKQLYYRAAQTYEDILEQGEDAVRVYQMVLDLDVNEMRAVEALERLYHGLKRWDDLKETYARKADLVQSSEEKKQIYYRMGSLHEEQLGDLERSVEAFQSVLDLDPDDRTAISALDRLYQRGERWYELLQVLERQVELAGPSADGVALKHRIAKLWEDQLGDLARAVETYREVLSADPLHQPTLEALQGIVRGSDEPLLAAQVLEPVYEQSLEWGQLVDLYEVMIRHVDDPYRKRELLHKVAQYRELKLDDARGAFDAYGRALKEDSADEPAIANLERLAADVDGWTELCGLYELELDKLLDPMRQAELGLRIARIHEEELGQADLAIEQYKRVLEADGESREAILALDRLYLEQGRFEELAETLRREVRMAGDEQEIIDLQFRLGQLYQDQLGDNSNAVEVYRDILASTPEHSPSVMALELLLDDGHHQREIAEILEPLYRRGEQWQKLVRIMQVQLERTEDDRDKVQTVQRIAEICEQRLGDSEQAFRWWGHALQCDPLSELVTDELERLARATGGWENLAGFYDQAVSRLEGDERARLLKMLARVAEVELGARDRAEEAYLRVLELDDRDPDALEALDRLYEQAGLSAQLAEVLQRRIEVTDAVEATIKLQLRLGALYETALDDARQAVDVHRSVLESDSRNPDALDALERIYFRGEQWGELFEIYEKMIDIAPGDAAVADCYGRMAKIASDALGEAEKARDFWNRVLDLKGEDQLALAALADLYEEGQEWRELVEILDRQSAIAADHATQVGLYERLGRIWGEKLGRERNALENWQRALDLDPHNLNALRAIAQLYENSQAWEELVGTLHQLIALGESSGMPQEELCSLYTRLGELQGEILGRPEEAIDAWRRVLQLRTGDFHALGALEQLLSQQARWEECIEVLEQKAVVLADPVERIDVLMQAANIWQDRVEDQDSAAGLYARVLEIDPAHSVAFVALEKIYREGDNWEKLVDLLLARVEQVEEVEESVELLQRVAKIYEERMQQPDAAFMVLQAAFKRDYANDVTVKELERLASLTNRWNELLGECNAIVQSVHEPKIKADLLVNMGLWYSELGHLDYATPSVQQALQIVPDSKRALDALASFHRKAGRWPELADVLNRSQELEQDPDRRVQLLGALGEILEHNLGDARQAINAHSRALELDDGNLEVLRSLERLYQASEQWDGLIGVLSRMAELAEDPDAVMKLRGRIGELFEGPVNDPEKAIQSYKDILVIEPQHLGALKALERLYESSGQSEDYLDVLEQQLDIAGADEERVALYRRMASVWEQQFGKPDRAAECLEKILLVRETDLTTYESLERLYREAGRYEDLVESYRQHANATGDTSQRAALYLAMGQAYEESLQDPDRAIEAYGETLALDPDHQPALSALARLYEEIEAWDKASEAMDRLSQLLEDKSALVDINYRMGRIHERQLADVQVAEERYARALEIDPTHAPSMVQLIGLYKERGDWAKAGQMMVRAEEHSSNQLEKARLFYEAGNVYREHLADEAAAARLYAQTLQVDPDHVEAGEPLAEIYFRDGLYAEAEPVLEMLIRKADRRNNRRLQELYFKLATTCERLNNGEKALQYYKLAYDIDSTDLPTLRGMADLLMQLEDWDRAFKTYQTILVHHRDSQQPKEVVDIFNRLGTIKLQLGERRKALNMFEKALDLDAHHQPTLEAVVDLHASLGDWEAVVAAKRSMLANVAPEKQFDLQGEIGEIYREKLGNLEKATLAYREALDLNPDSHPVLHSLVELYSETKQWKRAVEIVLKLAELDTAARLRARYLYTAAVVYRDEIRSLDESLHFFDKSLDETFGEVDATTQLGPDMFKAFEALDRICTQKKDWKAQERYYRKMIKRLPADGQSEWKVRLWHALGEIYRTRLREYDNAVAAFDVAVQLEPDNLQRREILAELYTVSGPEHYDKAATQHQMLIKLSPFKIESYRALRKIYMDLRLYDKAWCVCATLAFLKKADAEEQRFYEQYRQRRFVRATARMSDDLWRKLIFHPDEDLYIGAIFGLMAPVVGPMSARPQKHFGLKKKERIDLATDQLLFSKVFNYVTSVLNVQQADLYRRPDRAAGLQMAHTVDNPSFVVGGDLLQGRTEKELAFAIAKQLTYLRPEHFLRNVLGTAAGLRVAFFGALRLVNPQVPVPKAEEGEVVRLLEKLRKRLVPGFAEQLKAVVERFFARRAEVDLNRWLTAVELSASRIAFVLANDLEVAARLVSTEAPTAGALPPKEKVKELVVYSVSEEYFSVRRELGLTITVEGGGTS